MGQEVPMDLIGRGAFGVEYQLHRFGVPMLVVVGAGDFEAVANLPFDGHSGYVYG